MAKAKTKKRKCPPGTSGKNCQYPFLYPSMTQTPHPPGLNVPMGRSYPLKRTAGPEPDYRMPGMNGLELLARLRSGGDYREVIVTTGKSCRFYAEQCADLGVSGYIIKPYTGSELKMRLLALEERQPLKQ